MTEDRFTAFAGVRLLASGSSEKVAAAAKAAQAAGTSHVLIFDDATGEQVEVDPFVEPPAIAGRRTIEPPTRAGRGRPRLGVVAREVTLLPRHWDWLATQPGGASAVLRRLVEAASRDAAAERRRARDATYKVMTALAGNLPGYEEAVRTLFADNGSTLGLAISAWPEEVGDYLTRLAAGLGSMPTGNAT